jgi:2-methylaconitate cis-trans-isomerase PrpF
MKNRSPGACDRLEIVLMRGGTSKGVFVRENDLPPAGPERDQLLLRLMGSPDPMQIDGLGGTHSSTSKVMIVSPGSGTADIDYLFAQVAVDRALVDYSGNCGNLTAAVAAYAVDDGFVAADGAQATVLMLNRNTGRRIRALVQIERGFAATRGDVAIAGVPGTGAPIFTDYLDPGGAVTGQILPTGSARDQVLAGDETIDVSMVDVSGVIAIVRASDLGIAPDMAPAAANADAALLKRLETIRAAAAARIGLNTQGQPRLVLIAPPADHGLADGTQLAAESHGLIARTMSMGRMHHAIPFTVIQALAAAAHIPGTIARELGGAAPAIVRVAHPRGISDAEIVPGPNGAIEAVRVARTARRLLEGAAYLR